jgi:tellurite resistance protein TehA-like permease
MGTGILSILIHQLPYNAIWLQYISVVFFVLNCALFATFTGVSIARYALYPEIWPAMVNHPNQSLFLGTFPMGLASKCHPCLGSQP